MESKPASIVASVMVRSAAEATSVNDVQITKADAASVRETARSFIGIPQTT
jgi:hypothetical protein